MFNLPNLSSKSLLLGSASLAALLITAPANATTFTSMTGRGTAQVTGNAAPRPAGFGAASTPGQAATATAQSAADFSTALARIQAQMSAQAAMRSAPVAATVNVPDGLTAGGLVVDPRVIAGTDPNLWVNANAPTQAASGAQTTVTVQQTAQRAVTTWQSFNVGKNTTVHIDQTGGNSSNGNNWTMLARVDAAGTPSQIQGQIQAEGTVLLINPNGIVFGGSSQINVHSLIAAAMDLNTFSTGASTNNGVFNSTGNSYAQIKVSGAGIADADGNIVLAPANEDGANKNFLANGLFTNGGLQSQSITSGPSLVMSAGTVPNQANAGITVQKGAAITTSVSGFDNGGLVALVGPNVTNDGSIQTSAGQIILGAASTILIGEPAANTTQTGFAVSTLVPVNNFLFYQPPTVTGGAQLINDTDALLVAHRGNVTLIGDTVQQKGVAEATTSITRTGSINITAMGTPTAANPELGEVSFQPGSVTTILPEENGETIPSDAGSLASFVPPTLQIASTNLDMKPNSLILAPGAAMTVTVAPTVLFSPGLPFGRVLLETGSTIDLSGLNVTRSTSDYLFTFKVTANDIADTPLAQNLIGQSVTIDLSKSGTRSDGEAWVGSPLFASSGAGYLANITQGIDQILTNSGSLTVGTASANTNTFKDVITAQGSMINIAGGSVHYSGGTVNTTRLMTPDGRPYDIGSADPSLVYANIAGTFAVDHPRWNVTDSYTSALIRSTGSFKSPYVNGANAGSISIATLNPILEGDMDTAINAGFQQRTGASTLPIGAALSIALVRPDTVNHADAVILDSSGQDALGSAASIISPLMLSTNADGVPTIHYSASLLSSYGLGSLSISGADTIAEAQGASLSVLAGGSIKLTEVTRIDGALVAHGGAIAITGDTPFDLFSQRTSSAPLTLGATGLLDVSGLWVNDTGLYGDAYQGRNFINGGSVSITTNALSQFQTYDPVKQLVTSMDTTSSILLAQGSVIDVSSGGHVTSLGLIDSGANGVALGNAGKLSLATYGGGWVSPSIDPIGFGISGRANNFAPVAANAATIIFNGAIHAAGLAQGGTLSLSAPAITIDGNATEISTIASGAQTGTLVLPTALFTDSGFGAFNLTSTYGSTTLAADTTLMLQQKNYVVDSTMALPATGAQLADFASLGILVDGRRSATNLSLTQSAFLFGKAGDVSTTASLLIDAGSAIVADPGAAISLGGTGPIVVLGDITAPGGSIAINQTLKGQSLNNDGSPAYVWIGGNARLDVSGVFVPNLNNVFYATGKALDGGAISLTTVGSIIALQGSDFELSGTSAAVQMPGDAGLIPAYGDQPIWSNGGTLSLSSGTAFFDATIHAAGGAPQAAGGTLIVNNNLLNNIVITQSGDPAALFEGIALPTTASKLAALLPTPGGSRITADTIDASGLDSVTLTGSVAFSGNVSLTIPGTLNLINSVVGGTLTLLPDGVTNPAFAATCVGVCIPGIGGTAVTLNAGYIQLANTVTQSGSGTPRKPTLADGTLNLNAGKQLDIAGLLAINNADAVNLNSGGDIRLIGSNNNNALLNNGNANSANLGGAPIIGSLLVADDLTLTARTIYPTTDTAFLLMSLGLAPAAATGTHATIAIQSNGQAPVTPYSAGGAILIDAKTIQQGGALMAPLGTIQLGYSADQTLPKMFVQNSTSNPYDPVIGVAGLLFSIYGSALPTVTTTTVTLAPGSLTSVSAAGLSIPYGTTVDGGLWTENGIELNGPPSKLIVLGGANINTQAGAVVNGSGGGDVYASEFVPGTGGSRNVLTTATQTVYALVPGYAGPIAPSDPDFTTSVKAGSTVTLDGGNGIAAGTYTLLPAQYATVPGALRVVLVSKDTGNTAKVSETTADGSVFVTGKLGNAINGSQSPRTALFQIQSDAVWSKYSQINITRGDTYFTSLANSNGTTAPRLAVDAAQISIAATKSLSLDATNNFAPGQGGRGGQLDITGSNLLVVSSDLRQNQLAAADYSNYLVLDADQISGLGIESVLLGGTRSTTAAGVQITATALNLEVDTDGAHALVGPELLLSSLAPTTANPAMKGLIVDKGSVITAKGPVSAASSDGLAIGANPVAIVNGSGTLTGYTPGISGDGALLRVSNGGVVAITRNFVPGLYTPPATTPAAAPPVSSVARGNISIGSGASITANALTIDTSSTASVAGDAVLTAKNYDLGANIVNIGGGSGGLVLTADLIAKFAGAQTVNLRSASVFNLYGNIDFGSSANPIGTLTFNGAGLFSDGGTANVSATDIAFVNGQATPNLSGALSGAASGSLNLNASDAITFGGGVKVASGFANVSATGGAQILFTGPGSLDTKSANVTLTAPALVADANSSQGLTTTGSLSILQGGGTVPVLAATDIGGALTFSANGIHDSGTILTPGGNTTLHATGGDVILDGNAAILANGTRIAFGDLTQDTPAGTVLLAADTGNVALGANTLVDVSSAGNGYAGTLDIVTPGTATLNGAIKSGAAFDDLGGTFLLNAGQLAGALPLSSGFTHSFSETLGQGDITIAAGQTLKSANVLLVANSGSVNIAGTIDAGSPTGGTIALYGAGTSTAAAGTSGASGVTIASTGKLLARYQADDANSPAYSAASTLVQTGGTITLGTTGRTDGSLNAAYGYENVPASGAITVADGAILDVSGGAGGTDIANAGGTINLRAPILANNSVNVDFRGTVVTNADAQGNASGDGLVLNAFAVWSTTDAANPGKHFDGIIDPAGWFSADGTKIAGTTDSNTAIFTPTGAINGEHVAFYQTTLQNFVNAPFDTNAVRAAFANAKLQVGRAAATALPDSALHLRPELDLINPSAGINSGNIIVASNWNFGAGSIDPSGRLQLAYRTTDGGEPGTLSLMARNNVNINATITDGFFANYVYSNAVTSAAAAYDAEANSSVYQTYLGMFSNGVFQYDGSGLMNQVEFFGYTWEEYYGPGVPIPPDSSPASGSFYGISDSVFNSLQFQLQRPTILSCGGATCPINITDQYNQYYGQYVRMFDAFATVTTLNNADVFAFLGVKGGAYEPYQYLVDLWASFGVPLDLSPLVVPNAPALGGSYYNIHDGLGLSYDPNTTYTTATTSDYASQWAAYFYTVVAVNGYSNSGGPYLTGMPDLNNILNSNGSAGGSFNVAATPPYAPPAYTTQQAGYVSSLTSNPTPPSNQIADNPGIYSVGNAPFSNTTSSSQLMTAAMSGKGSFSYDFVAGANFGPGNALAVNPNAVVTVASVDPNNPVDSIIINGHTVFTNVSAQSGGRAATAQVAVPTLVRTGTGDITLTAAGDVEFIDPVVQGAVYTAGVAAPTPSDFTPLAHSLANVPDNGLISTPAWANGGGNVTVNAGHDLTGIETTRDNASGSLTGVANGVTGQLWSDWYFHAGLADGDAVPFDTAGTAQTSAWVNYGTFFQQFGALGGGNIALTAGGNITDISASLPEGLLVSGGTSAGDPPVLHSFGGGDLSVNAGGDLNSGAFLVGRGVGDIRIGGAAQATAVNPLTGLPTLMVSVNGSNGQINGTASLPLVLAVQDGFIDLTARGNVALANVFDPASLPLNITMQLNLGSLPGSDTNRTVAALGAPFTSLGADSGVSLTSISGDITALGQGAGNSEVDAGLFLHNPSSSHANLTNQVGWLLPSTLDLIALSGDVTISPDPTFGNGIKLLSFPTQAGDDAGNLVLVAGGSITFGQPLGMADVSVDAAQFVKGNRVRIDYTNYVSPLGTPLDLPIQALHANDPDPAIVAAKGDILFGVTLPSGFRKTGSLASNKPADIWAGGDIINIAFTGQNNNADDITSIIAGGNIEAQRYLQFGKQTEASASITIYGPGDLLVQAGGDLGPFATGLTAGGGILAVGDGSNAKSGVRPYLPDQSANLTLLYGVGPGIDYAAAINQYVDPANAGTGGINYLSDIAGILGQTPGQAWVTFRGLPRARQQLLVDRAYLDFLIQVANDFKDPASPYFQQYARAYDTIATLFPANLGYTDNNSGESNGASATVHTGDMHMARSLVETQTGGDINIIGPGGNLFVGSNLADSLNPSTAGIITLGGGSIRTYTDSDVQIFQSRIFTEQGGDVDLFSANGDLNAGKGPKSSASFPRLQLICDQNGYCRVNPTGLVTGAGIGALLTIPGQDPSKSNAVLTAPHGTVDAGAAGIRVAGDLNIVALTVANAFNIDVGGKSFGLPPQPVTNLTLTTASTAATEAAAIANNSHTQQPTANVEVEVTGYGGMDSEHPERCIPRGGDSCGPSN